MENKLTSKSSSKDQHILEEIERQRVLFEQTWGQPGAPSIEQILDKVPKANQSDLLRELLYVEFEFIQRNNATLSLEQYLVRFPEYEVIIRKVAEAVDQYTVFKRRSIAGYTLLSELGRGGMGVVYRAQHEHLRKIVAFKIARDPEMFHRFKREMLMNGRLKHENIVEAIDAGVTEDTPYLVMEFVDGVTLNQWSKQNPPLSEKSAELSRITEICKIIRDVAAGLQAIHEAELVHRDIKPGNIMLLTDGRVKILDLGLAKLRDSDAGEHSSEPEPQTRQGQFLGTLGYMAPEQMHSAPHVDIGADIYSLGCTFVFLLTGHTPQSNPSKEIPEWCPQKLRTILNRMLDANPVTRFQEPSEVVAALDQFLDSRPKSRVKNVVIVTTILVLLGVVVAFFIPKPPVKNGLLESQPSPIVDPYLLLLRQYTEAIGAKDDRLLRLFVEQFEMSTEPVLMTPEALELRLSALENLIGRCADSDRTALSKYLRSLDVILLAPYPEADSCVYLNRFFDLAIRHCDPTDYGQLVKYLLRLRPQGPVVGRPSIPPGSTLVLIYFSPWSGENGFAIYYPAERQESRRFELPFNRSTVKEAIHRDESLELDDELVSLIRRDIGSGVLIVLSWDDTACWPLRRDALSNEDWPFDKSITVEELLGQMK